MKERADGRTHKENEEERKGGREGNKEVEQRNKDGREGAAELCGALTSTCLSP